MRLPGIAVLLLLLVAAGARAGAETSLALDCSRSGVPIRVRIDPEGLLRADVVVTADDRAVFLVEEDGRDLEVQPEFNEDWIAVAARPPRLGMWGLSIDRQQQVLARVAASHRAAAEATLTLHCRPAPAIENLPRCLELAARAASSDVEIDPGLLTSSALCTAFVLHATATHASASALPSASVLGYEELASAWATLGDTERARAALLGVAEQRGRLGEYQAVVAASERIEQDAMRPAAQYFAARAQSLRCLALRQLGRTAEADACLAPLPARFLAIDEPSEAANSWYSIASIAMADGNEAAAERAFTAAGRIEPQLVSPLVRGRLQRLQALLHQRRGDVGSAMVAARRSAELFERLNHLREQANTNLVLARLNSAIGATHEAGVFADAALRGFPATEAPARRAAVLNTLAEILAAEQPQRAAMLAAEAAELFQAAAMPLSQARSIVQQALLEPDLGRRQALRGRLEPGSLPPALQIDIQLLDLDSALRSNDFAQAEALLQRLSAGKPGYSQLRRLELLRARTLLASGRVEAALLEIEASIESARATALRASSPALRHTAGRRLAPLRQLWVDGWLASPPSVRPSTERLWQVLQSTRLAPLLGRGSATERQPDPALDRALAAVLLPAADADPAAQLQVQRLLLQQLEDGLPGATTPLPPLSALMARMGAGDAWFGPALGSDGAIGLLVDAHGAHTIELGDSQDIRASLQQLLELLQDPAAPIAGIEAEAERLGGLLLPRFDATTRRLHFAADESLAGVPLALLIAPGNQSPLVDQLSISLVDGVPASDAVPASAQELHALIAALEESGVQTALPRLFGAAQEPAVIAAALPSMPVIPTSGRKLDRAALYRALQRPGGWTHIAAHGSTRSELQAHAGLWLAPQSPAAAPAFVGWLDLGSQPLRNSLVVLNACELARAGSSSTHATASFAAALGAAGVDHVVAALWPVSDSASSTWIPKFYGSLHGGLGVAEALRQTQLEMRRSRRFRHPSHWAALVHLQR